ncbi:MAG: M20 family peptidase [Desulfobacteraceae bacterium]|nr:M20 family peptidase [Desulfobacteraceae bacterium]
MLFFILLVCFILILFVNTWLFSNRQLTIEQGKFEEVDTNGAIQRLSESIQLKTISVSKESETESKVFLDFHTMLATSFPAINKNLGKEVINKFSLLYKWPGKNPELAPMAFLAHMDVVPVEPGTEKDWECEPFSGEIDNGFVWGRGTLDMKGTLMAVMESVEILLNNGFSPERTIYLAFGHDEEIGGSQGAKQIAAYLKKQGVRFSYTLDEGMAVLNEELSPCGKSVGVIGIAEKGYITLKLEVAGQGGHSSAPPSATTIGRLCKAVTRLEKEQMPAKLAGPAYSFFQHVGPDMSFGKKLLFANLWIFKPLVLLFLGKINTTNAMIRTTTAPTIIQGGVKENILPIKAHLLVNFRIMPGDSVQKVVEHVKKVVNDDNVDIEILGNIVAEPPNVSSTDSYGYLNIKKTIYQIFPGTSVTPGLVIAMTDSRHYADISDNCYRFAPFVFSPEDTPRIHGTNERVSTEGYIHAIQYYLKLIKNTV